MFHKKFLNRLIELHIVFALLFLGGCGDYTHYGLESGVSTDTLEQTDPFFITDNYEFKSILYKSDDGNLTISIQHPLHPIPEPNVFISQVEFDLKNPLKGLFSVEAVELKHETNAGSSITPIETQTITMKEVSQPAFLVLKYSRDSLTPEIIEYAEVIFNYNGKTNTVKFREHVELVKRWSKFEILIKS